MSDIVISGYYGFRNSGDDALLMSIINDLKAKKPDAEVVVLSKNPKETRKIYNVRAVRRENIFAVINEIRNAKMLISGGGTLMQDGTSTKSLLYYLTIIKIAQMFSKKIMLYANGMGPLYSKKNRERVKKTLNDVDIITLRDEETLKEIKRLGIDKPYIEVTADPAFSLPVENLERFNDITTEVPGSEQMMLVSVRDWQALKPDFRSVIAEVCDYAAEKYGLYTVFLPMQPQKDMAVTEQIRKLMKHESSLICGNHTIKQQLSLFGDMRLCIGMRLHSLIYSAAMCVPQIGIAYDPKINGFLDYIGSDSYIDCSKLTANELIKEIDICIENYDSIKGRLTKKRKELQTKADRNAVLAVELLERRTDK